MPPCRVAGQRLLRSRRRPDRSRLCRPKPDSERPFRLLETLRWDPADGYALLEEHLTRLIAEGRVRERVVRLEELAGRRFWPINSVRGWQEGVLVDAVDNPLPDAHLLEEP